MAKINWRQVYKELYEEILEMYRSLFAAASKPCEKCGHCMNMEKFTNPDE